MAAQEHDAPRVRVAALMLLDGKVVLARHRAGTSVYHLLPGGGLRYRETVEEALVREIREETGLLARLSRLLFINDTIDPNGWRHLVNLTFLAEVYGGEITNDPKDARVEAVDLVDPEKLSELDLRPPLAPYIAQALSDGLDSTQARYLGSLFSDAKTT